VNALFRDDLGVGLAKLRVNSFELFVRFGLNPQMIDAELSPRCEMAKFTRGSSSIHLA
jgi:hypothetical protein